MEDIHLAIQTPARKQDRAEVAYYCDTFKVIINGFNQFFADNFEELRGVIPTYMDIICLFVTTNDSSQLVQIVINCYTNFLAVVGKFYTDSDWE